MEMFELHYFHAVAELENIQKASVAMHISPSSLSKAITRLEEEFNVKLFKKDGRHIRLTEKGKILFQQSKQFLALEKLTQLKLKDSTANLSIKIAGPEIFLSHFGTDICLKIKNLYPHAIFNFQQNEEMAIEDEIINQNFDLGIICEPKVKKRELKYTLLLEANFHVYVIKTHNLFKKNKVDINEILKYEFLSPSLLSLGNVDSNISNDGWNDEKFLRKISFHNAGLKSIENIVKRGEAIAYLPSYFAESLNLKKLEVMGCPYKCSQKIMLVSNRNVQWIAGTLEKLF